MTDELPPEATQQPAEATPLAAPTRPAAGGAITSAWGADVHDRTFKPQGVIVAGANTPSPVNGTWLDLATVISGGTAGATLDAVNNAVYIQQPGVWRVDIWITVTGAPAGGWAINMQRSDASYIFLALGGLRGGAGEGTQLHGTWLGVIPVGENMILSWVGAGATSAVVQRFMVQRLGDTLT